jgi:methylglutaconyl-CoA hydratase
MTPESVRREPVTSEPVGPRPVAGPPVRYAVVAGVATLTMDQPATRNALTPELLDGLRDGIARAEADGDVRVLVLTHTGPAWCAGADLRAGRPTATPESPAAPTAAVGIGGLPAVMTAITRSRLPVVARLTGAAMGGGVGLAAACDLSVAAEDVRLGFTEVRLGVAPAVISVVCLPKLRRADALELFLTGERITAARAADIGLITTAVPAGDVDATVGRYVTALLAGGPGALAAAKALVHDGPGGTTEEAYARLADLSAALFASDEGQEGRAAFREKRPASWIPVADPPPTDVPPTDLPPTDLPPTDLPPADLPGPG